MYTRYVSAALTAAAVTLALFILMPALIALQPAQFEDPRERMALVFTRLIEDSPLERIEKRREFRELKQRVEPAPQRTTTEPGKATIRVPSTAPAPQPAQPGITGVDQDGPLVAMIRVEPVYPIRASEQGLEGHVIVEFDVTPSGSVVNARVIESSHRIFENSALDAVMKFRFRPRIVGGVREASVGLQNVFRFRMERG